jgi:hypothetical protein
MSVISYTGRTALYRLFDADGALLYVGVSDNPRGRWNAHATEKPWWHEVADRKVIWLETRDEALAKETRAICDEHPRYNILGTEKHREVSGGRRDIDVMTEPFLADILTSLAAIDDPAERARALGATLDAVPGYQQWLRLARQQALKDMRAEGMSYATIGKKLGISRARAQQIVEG